MVKEEEKKTEKITKRMNDLESCNNSVKLLNDMLTHFDASVTSEGERDLMKVFQASIEDQMTEFYYIMPCVNSCLVDDNAP